MTLAASLNAFQRWLLVKLFADLETREVNDLGMRLLQQLLHRETRIK